MVRCNVGQSGHDRLDVLIQTVIWRPAFHVNINERKPGHCVCILRTLLSFFSIFEYYFIQLSSEFFRDHSLPKLFASCFCFDHIPEIVRGKSGVFWSYQVLQRISYTGTTSLHFKSKMILNQKCSFQNLLQLYINSLHTYFPPFLPTHESHQYIHDTMQIAAL